MDWIESRSELQQNALSMYLDGVERKKINEILNCSKSVVDNVIQRYNLEQGSDEEEDLIYAEQKAKAKKCSVNGKEYTDVMELIAGV